ncbi:hypothetical protein LM12_0180 [Staphylococcus phage vB_SauM_LM12]|uniref:Uncharacterized protein n=2 Tax=Kayvirus G1 TaxID=292029 RepID=I6W8N2_9CAUD|nr:hypothetical protein QLX30_gp050 [Staphylococcus phage A3R]YP_009780971.1 hypothetical protein QLX31_gp053 [Staphylococcus phage 676Z]AUV57088.1 hypothetical protein LM12_0180 [Staphylococcus phage vB_SauM_LM12]AVX47410.1 hypothetical protein C5023_000056 [Staphylococcus phage vB_SauM_0414_108]AZB49979.1 putative non-cytoplasmic protein [Staphylococcus phage 812h1]QEM41305.1 hypothetical protein CPT_Maine_056 [Staphylococcus phage Maine]WJJ56850.1 hypothetical protein vBSAP01_059 [Staphylo
MEKLQEDYVNIDIRVKAYVRVGYRYEEDITNNLHELVEDNLNVTSDSDNLIIKDTEIKGDIE